jgi:hypothetical protein
MKNIARCEMQEHDAYTEQEALGSRECTAPLTTLPVCAPPERVERGLIEEEEEEEEERDKRRGGQKERIALPLSSLPLPLY